MRRRALNRARAAHPAGYGSGVHANRITLSAAIGVCLIAGGVAGWFGTQALGVGAVLGLLFISGVAFFFLIFYLRRRQTGTYSYGVRRLEGQASGHRVTLEFEERLMEPNRLRLLVDGDELASDTILLGTKELLARTRDGIDLSVKVRSGWLGTCTDAVVTAGGGKAQPLVDRATNGRSASG